MTLDFTQTQYLGLLDAFQQSEFSFVRMADFFDNSNIVQSKTIILRHDVDKKPLNSLEFATIQSNRNICGTYYFRIVPESFDESIIREIAGMGHEIGYHYETMDSCRGNIDKAWDEFRLNLEIFRKIVPVNTICMHGSPRSPFDNKLLWQKYDYHSLGITGEPYLDIDFNSIAYFTDTGRRWNGASVSIRDKVNSPFNFNLRHTKDIISNLEQLPSQLMFTFHPQRWNDKLIPWLSEFAMQKTKNLVKAVLYSKR